MESLIIILYICVVAPIIMMLFVFKGDSRKVLAFLIGGMTICLLAYRLNTLAHMLLRSAYLMKSDYYTVNISPLLEELLKALPILVFAFVCKPKRQLLLECAIAVGVGFAIIENAYILSGAVSAVTIEWAAIRGFGTGLMHAICTVTVGYGMSFVHTKKKLFYTGTLGLLCIAILYHSMYNNIMNSAYAYYGPAFPIITYAIFLLVSREKKLK